MQFSEQFQSMEAYIHRLQDTICQGLEALDEVRFQEDLWKRPEGGGGRTRVIADGQVWEKGGVNVSSVNGRLADEIAKHLKTEPMDFGACGISLVIHPQSPRVPTIHMNVRYFEMENGRSWFGGGIDLTPYYPHTEDFQHFHETLQNACNRIIPDSYPGYKKYCDEYFTVKHRHEMRGIGGVFFDYLPGSEGQHFELVQSVGDAFLKAYCPIVERRKTENYAEADKQFQLVRRGRYVEFNLIYDRGTLFGLKTNGRIESIFMSLPPEVHFHYDWHPEPNSPHADMMQYYQPHDWVT